jgi:hypothetical protein
MLKKPQKKKIRNKMLKKTTKKKIFYLTVLLQYYSGYELLPCRNVRNVFCSISLWYVELDFQDKCWFGIWFLYFLMFTFWIFGIFWRFLYRKYLQNERIYICIYKSAILNLVNIPNIWIILHLLIQRLNTIQVQISKIFC